jgi:hypothetical protein
MEPILAARVTASARMSCRIRWRYCQSGGVRSTLQVFGLPTIDSPERLVGPGGNAGGGGRSLATGPAPRGYLRRLRSRRTPWFTPSRKVRATMWS